MIPASSTATVERCWKEAKCKLPVQLEYLECASWLFDASWPKFAFVDFDARSV
jgi:hypothetical protein